MTSLQTDLSGSFNDKLVLKIHIEMLSGVDSNSNKVGTIVSPGIPYHPTFFIINEMVQAINRSSLLTYAMILEENNKNTFDSNAGKKKSMTYASFSPEYLFDNITSEQKSKKENRVYNTCLNVFNPRVSTKTILKILEFCSKNNSVTMKLPTISAKTIDDLLVLFIKSYEKVVVSKPHDDIWLMDNFYVTLENKKSDVYINEVRNIIEEKPVKNKDAKKEDETYIVSIYNMKCYINSAFMREYKGFKLDMIDRVVDKLNEIRTLIPRKGHLSV